MPAVIHPGSLRETYLADNLRPQLQRVARVPPCAVRQLRPERANGIRHTDALCDDLIAHGTFTMPEPELIATAAAGQCGKPIVRASGAYILLDASEALASALAAS